jgi:hypothetical protein
VLPALAGLPIRVVLKPSLGDHLAATSIPRRVVYLDAAVLARSGDFERILLHELFHFVWVRLSNDRRRSWETVIAGEMHARETGELGWSAEWRKQKLSAADIHSRSLRWRSYACESFCDTAAWLYAGLRRHDEFTLAASSRRARRAWFRASIDRDTLRV